MTEDMFQALKIGIIVHRGGHGGGVDPAPRDLLDGATRNGARALGIADRNLQMLYGFTVGGPVEDPRLVTEPAYSHLDRADSGRD